MAVFVATNNLDHFLIKPLRFEFSDDSWVICDLALVINGKELLHARGFCLYLPELDALRTMTLAYGRGARDPASFEPMEPYLRLAFERISQTETRLSVWYCPTATGRDVEPEGRLPPPSVPNSSSGTLTIHEVHLLAAADALEQEINGLLR